MKEDHVRIAALLTCHNRKEKTLACLQALEEQVLPPRCHLDIILVDDGSADGTGEAVRAAYAHVNVLQGNGSLFWNGGMRVAFAHALRAGYDHYLWINDDTVLYPEALSVLLNTYHILRCREGKTSLIIAGSTRDSATGAPTYGGRVRCSRWHPLKYALIRPSNQPVSCDVMNGNCVLIPHVVAQRTGNLDSRFTHAIGDFDYAMRARKLGAAVWIPPGYVGTCPKNSKRGGWRDTRLPIGKRWSRMRGAKGLPPREWLEYARRYAGWLWPFYGSLPYLRLLVTALVRR